MTGHSAPPPLRRCGLETAQTNRQSGQILTPSPQTLALLLGEEIRRIAAELAQRRNRENVS